MSRYRCEEGSWQGPMIPEKVEAKRRGDRKGKGAAPPSWQMLSLVLFALHQKLLRHRRLSVQALRCCKCSLRLCLGS